MKLVVIGCGRVGSAVARDLAEDGWDVTAVDEQEEALTRLGGRWAGGFVVGHGMDAEILQKAGVPDADAATRTDPRATIYAAHMLGIRHIVAWDTVIALNPVLPRGQVAVMADYIDFTRGPGSFDGAPPSLPPNPEAPLRAVCPRLTGALRRALPFSVEIVYVSIDGPRRETAAEARIFRQWGADVVGQNMVPEAALAQEAGICFAGLVTVAELSAERSQTPPSGEVRASLGATLNLLPTMLALASAETCDCLGTVSW